MHAVLCCCVACIHCSALAQEIHIGWEVGAVVDRPSFLSPKRLRPAELLFFGVLLHIDVPTQSAKFVGEGRAPTGFHGCGGGGLVEAGQVGG